ncbi:MAG: DMT family transporter [Phycisphaerae bacterium]
MLGQSVSASELAGLATAFLWTLSALAWSFCGRRIGSVPTAAIRILLAGAILFAIHWLVFGSPWPRDKAGAPLAGEPLVLLVISGILGACIADMLQFRGLVLIGPRYGTLILALSPVMSAAMAWLPPMNETLGPGAVAGIALTLGGVAWVVAEPHERRAWRTTKRGFRLGVVLSLAAALVAAAGYVVSRMAMQAGPRWFIDGPPLAGVDPFVGSMVRVVAAAGGIWLALPFMRSLRPTLRGLADRRAMLIIIGGTIVGPVVGIWMSMIALAGAKAGIAVTLINTSPLMMIPLAYLAYGERPTWRALVGTAVAIAGIFVLMWK